MKVEATGEGGRVFSPLEESVDSVKKASTSSQKKRKTVFLSEEEKRGLRQYIKEEMESSYHHSRRKPYLERPKRDIESSNTKSTK